MRCRRQCRFSTRVEDLCRRRSNDAFAALVGPKASLLGGIDGPPMVRPPKRPAAVREAWLAQVERVDHAVGAGAQDVVVWVP